MSTTTKKPKTEVGKLLQALESGAKTKSELEQILSMKSVVKNVVDRARKNGFSITYEKGLYTLEKP